MNIHAPERQPDETYAGYQERRKVSRQMFKESQRGIRVAPFSEVTLFVTQHHATPTRKERRDLVRLLGVRQYKKIKRGAK